MPHLLNMVFTIKDNTGNGFNVDSCTGQTTVTLTPIEFGDFSSLLHILQNLKVLDSGKYRSIPIGNIHLFINRIKDSLVKMVVESGSSNINRTFKCDQIDIIVELQSRVSIGNNHCETLVCQIMPNAHMDLVICSNYLEPHSSYYSKITLATSMLECTVEGIKLFVKSFLENMKIYHAGSSQLYLEADKMWLAFLHIFYTILSGDAVVLNGEKKPFHYSFEGVVNITLQDVSK
jgi:hypothetical protein